MSRYAPTPPPRPPKVPPRSWKSWWLPYPGGALAVPPDVARRWRDAGLAVVFDVYSVECGAAPVAAPAPAAAEPAPAGQLSLFAEGVAA